MLARRTRPYPMATSSDSHSMRITSWPALARAPAARRQASRQAGWMPSAVDSAMPIRFGRPLRRVGGFSATITPRACRTPSTVRAIGAVTESPAASTSAVGTRLTDGLRPTMPQHDAGIRMEPPMSVPTATRAIPAASAAPLPPEDPPGV